MEGKKQHARLKSAVSSILQAVVILIGVTFISFFLLHLSPKNPAEIWLIGTDGNAGQLSQETIEAQEEAMGLDKPLLVQYLNWLAGVLQGDLGVSFTTGEPVTQVILERLKPTIALAFLSLVLTLMISVPLGTYCACFQNRFLDHVTRVISVIGISLPSFLVSLILMWFFCLKLDLLPVIAKNSIQGIILPAMVLTIQTSAKLIRQIRGAVLTELKKDYVLGSLARGCSRRRILFCHVFRNILPQLLTWTGIYLGVLLGGAAIVETVFSWNGIGKLIVDAVTNMDYYVIQGSVLVIALLFLGINLLVDLLSKWADPRIGRQGQ